MRSKMFLLVACLVIILGTYLFVLTTVPQSNTPIIQESFGTIITTPTTNTPLPSPRAIPDTYVIPQKLHVFQTFNNCGPATLSMALSYFNLNVSQQELGQILRPYQVANGDNDDKNVSLYEVADEARRRGLYSYVRPNGDINKLKQFLSSDIIVITRTWLKTNEDIGHFRIIRGYDDNTQEIIQDDSYQGKNLRYSYVDFIKMWEPFNFEYLILVTPEKKARAEEILGTDLDEITAWHHAQEKIEASYRLQPENWHLGFALSRIYFYLKNYQQSVELYTQVESHLSFRTLWYQIEPIEAIYELGDYSRVFALTDSILNNQNRAFSELYFIRGNIYKRQGNFQQSKEEYMKAVLYNSNKQIYKNALEEINQL